MGEGAPSIFLRLACSPDQGLTQLGVPKALMHHVTDLGLRNKPLESVRKASRDALSRSEEDRPSAFFPGPPIALTRCPTEPVERKNIPSESRAFRDF